MENTNRKIYYDGPFSLSQEGLKFIALVAMVIDHFAWKFVHMGSIQSDLMHFIGRLTMPIMCYFIAEGFYKTKNLYKYALRLFIFAVISHFPFQYYKWGEIPLFHPNKKNYFFPLAFIYTSVIYTLFMGLLALIVVKKLKVNFLIKVILLICIYSLTLYCDYEFTGVLWVLAFGVFHDDRYGLVTSFLLVTSFFIFKNGFDNISWFIYGTYLPILLILLYNGKKNNRLENNNGKQIEKPGEIVPEDNLKIRKFNPLKWFFYIFYPGHILLLGILKYVYFPKLLLFK